MNILVFALVFALVAGPAMADPGSLIVALLGGQAALGVVGTAIVRLVVGIGLSALAQRLRGRRDRGRDRPGLRTQVTTQGGTMPQTMMLGTYATAGNIVAPFYAHGSAGGVDNGYRVQVIDLSDHPIDGVDAVWIDGRRFSLSEDMNGPVHADYGLGVNPATQPRHAGAFWLRIHDGRQTSADPMLVARHATHPARPWSANHIGKGVAYAVLTFRYSPELFRAEPEVRFAVRGARLYDWRRDSTAGGSGAQRWNDPATWTHTDNPIVMVWNIFRGIPLADGAFWGLGVAAQDLPTAWWTAAADRCDQVTGSRKRYRAGFEARMATPDQGGDTPFDVIDRLLEACDGEVCDEGGRWLVSVAEPGLPLAAITDDDLLLDHTDEFDPFPPMAERFNGVRATCLAPGAGWESRELPPRDDATAAAEDGRRIVASLDLDAVFVPAQAQQLMRAWLKDARRFRRHVITLPPEYDRLRVFDTVTWTSAQNGYDAKLFRVERKQVDPDTLSVTLSLRERNPADYDWSPADELPDAVVPPVTVDPPPATVPGWGVTAVTLTNAAGTRARPALRLSWTADLPGVSAIRWQVRRTAGAVPACDGSTENVDQGGVTISEGLIGDTAYQVRARPVMRRHDTAWTAWTGVTTDEVRVTPDDLDPTAMASAPTGLSLSSRVDTIPGGGQAGTLIATWNALSGANHYEVEATPSGGGAVQVKTSATRAEIRALAGQGWSVKVRGVNSVGAASPWSTAASHTTTTDNTPPAKVTGLTLTPGFGLIWLEWAASAATDLSHYEVYEAASATPAPTGATTPTFTLRGTQMGRSGLGNGVTRHYWVRAVDTSGNKGAWSDRAQETTAASAGVNPSDLAAVLNDVANAGIIPAPALSADAILATNVAITSPDNLVTNSTLAIATGWTLASGVAIDAAPTDMAAAKGFKYTDVTAIRHAIWQTVAGSVTEGEWYLLSFRARAEGTAPRQFTPRWRVEWFDVAGASLSSTAGVFTALTGTTPQDLAVKVQAPAGAVYATVGFGRKGDASGEVNTGWITNPGFRVMGAGRLIVDGAITANLLSADEVITSSAQIRDAIIGTAHISDISANVIDSGEMSSRYLRVDERMEVGTRAAVTVGKSAPDDPTDGLFFGQADDGAGGTSFALSASRTSGLIRQEITLTKEKFRLTNASHAVTSETLPTSTTRDTDLASTALPAGTMRVRIASAWGGGGGGSSGGDMPGLSRNAGSAGGNTVVKLYDGATLKKTYAATGGAGGSGYCNHTTGHLGGSSSIAGGGSRGGAGSNSRGGTGANGGRAAGGGGGGGEKRSDKAARAYGGQGGTAAVPISTAWVDVSGWANPKIQITIGAGGTGGAQIDTWSGAGGTGGAGRVIYETTATFDIPADVVPLKPTATGTFSSSGSSFPDLGAGFWLVGDPDNGISAVNPGDGSIAVGSGAHFSFFSSQTPTYTRNATKTVTYKFYSMGSWG